MKMNEEFFDKVLQLVDWVNDFAENYQEEMRAAGAEIETSEFMDWLSNSREFSDLCHISEVLEDTGAGLLEWTYDGEFPYLVIDEVFLLIGNQFYIAILSDWKWLTCVSEVGDGLQEAG